MMQEIQLLRKLSFDRNIVQFYGACLQEENTMMVLEYMEVKACLLSLSCSLSCPVRSCLCASQLAFLLVGCTIQF